MIRKLPVFSKKRVSLYRYIDICMKDVKKITLVGLALLLMMVACAGRNTSTNNEEHDHATPRVVQAELWDYRIVKEYPHPSENYTQGLQYVDGTMWEGTGQKGDSRLVKLDLATGRQSLVASLPAEEFGEGITHYKGHIYQLTWLSERAHVYDTEGNHLRTISYKGEGWGITTDGERLFMSDGTSVIRQVDPESFRTLRSICVTLNGQPLDLINELEWIDGRIWANVYLTHSIIVINPESGVVEGYVDMPELFPSLKDNPEAEAFNGIAHDPATGHIFVTGKDWNRLFEIEVIK